MPTKNLKYLFLFTAFRNLPKISKWFKTNIYRKLGMWFFKKRRRPAQSDNTVARSQRCRSPIHNLLFISASTTCKTWHCLQNTSRQEMDCERLGRGNFAVLQPCTSWKATKWYSIWGINKWSDDVILFY